MDFQQWVDLIGRLGIPTGLLAWIVWLASKWGSELVKRHLVLVDELVVSLREIKALAQSMRERECR